jgi:hypothetical protein
MNPNSAYSLVPIVVGTDYTPTEQFTTHDDPNLGPTSPPGPTVSNGLNSPVYALFCTVSNTGSVQIQLLGDAAPITFPAGSFKQGVIYYMYLKTLVADGSGSFIGFRYNAYPFTL